MSEQSDNRDLGPIDAEAEVPTHDNHPANAWSSACPACVAEGVGDFIRDNFGPHHDQDYINPDYDPEVRDTLKVLEGKT